MVQHLFLQTTIPKSNPSLIRRAPHGCRAAKPKVMSHFMLTLFEQLQTLLDDTPARDARARYCRRLDLQITRSGREGFSECVQAKRSMLEQFLKSGKTIYICNKFDTFKDPKDKILTQSIVSTEARNPLGPVSRQRGSLDSSRVGRRSRGYDSRPTVRRVWTQRL